MTNPVPHIADMAAYALADLTAPKGKRLISLSQNESVRPPSPAVAEAMRQATQTPHLYPDPDWTTLRTAIADLHQIDAADIICGNGSLDLIGGIARAYLCAGRAALVPEHAYPFFRTATQMTGARIDIAAETKATVDVDTLLAQTKPDTYLVFVANPGNPTGTRLPRSELLRLRDGLPNQAILVIDEAYGEFSDHLNEPMFDLVTRDDTIVLRTFSKAYGLAGLRVGWGLFPAQIGAQMRKLLNPNNVALPGQMAATAAVHDQAYMRETCDITIARRDAFATRLRQMGLSVPDSFTNFTLVRFPSAVLAAKADAMLRHEGVFVRPQTGAGLPDCLRVTTGAAEDIDVTADLLADWCHNNGVFS